MNFVTRSATTYFLYNRDFHQIASTRYIQSGDDGLSAKLMLTKLLTTLLNGVVKVKYMLCMIYVCWYFLEFSMMRINSCDIIHCNDMTYSFVSNRM